MIELLNEEVALIGGGVDEFGPYTPDPNPYPGCPNLEAFKRWRELNPFYGY